MPPLHGGRRATLGQGLDREVYQAVKTLLNNQGQSDNPHIQRLSASVVYEKIKRSNSSLNRKSKKLLESSIERVLELLKEEATSTDDVDSVEGDFDPTEPSKPSNGINRSIVGAWAKGSMQANDVQVSSHDGKTDLISAPDPRKRQSNGEPLLKKRKAAPAIDRSPPTHISLANLGGVDSIIQQLEDMIVLPLLQPEIYATAKIQPPRGILLHGPPGCGKTMIAKAFAAEVGVSFISLSAPTIVSGMSGESEKALREHFEEAKKVAPCLVFIDEIDAITPKRESAQREMEKRIVAQLLTCMDDLAGKAVIVIAATNRPDSLDAALRRGGRFDKEINLGVPNECVREQILRALTKDILLPTDFDYHLLAKLTPGFVGADLNDLVSTAGSAAIKRFLETLKAQASEMDVDGDFSQVSAKVLELRRLIKHAKQPSLGVSEAIFITIDDFLTALPKIQPSSKREGFATVPETTWADIGALRPVREELLTAIVEPIRSPEKYERVGITAPTGVLLWGPPGCGKTLLAKAVANESKANFISVKGPELLNKYVGESERAVRQVFVRARSSIPCVIFFDELDALVPKRDDALSESSARVVNTLLTELDGLSSRQGIYVVAATNRPDIIDPAMLRPGRLETLLFVDLPGEDERVEILQTLSRNLSIPFTDAIAEIARSCHGFSGADLESLLRRAGYAAIKRNDIIKHEDFISAKGKVRPSGYDEAFRHPLFALYEFAYQAWWVMPSVMRVVHQQQGDAQSPLSYEPTTSPASEPEAQREQKALGPSMQHHSSSSHSLEHARHHEPQDRPTSASSQPDPLTLPQEHTDQSSSRRSRQRFGDYLRLVWIDWLFIVSMYVFSGILYFWAPMYREPYRIIPMWYDPVKKTWYGPVSLSCQKNGWPSVISSDMTAVAVFVVPLGVFLCIQLFTKSFWDAHHAKTGLIQALALMTLFQEIFKRYIGEYRPYFLEACMPHISTSIIGSPYSPTWFRITDICAKPLAPNAWQSFPSGHTGSSFAAGTFLAIYLNAKLKAFSNYNTSFWKYLCVLAPLLGAVLISTGMIIDCSHHGHDVIISMFIGIIFGIFAYRAHYHSCFDYRNNHIPLPIQGQTRSFKLADASTNTASEPMGKDTGEGDNFYGPNSSHPDKHLAVRWPFGLDEKRGSKSIKKGVPTSGPDVTTEKDADDVRSSEGRMALDGNSSVNGVLSTRVRSSTEQASVIHHRPTDNDGASSFRSNYTMADAASIRDRELIGSGVGSEVADMV